MKIKQIDEKKNVVQVHIELPTTEEGLASLDDLSMSFHWGEKIRNQVHSSIIRFLSEKYKDKFDLQIDIEEIKKEVKDRIVDRLVEKAISNAKEN